jgi:hypothetical protein
VHSIRTASRNPTSERKESAEELSTRVNQRSL